MSREAANLADDLKQEAAESFDPRAMRSTEGTTKVSASLNSTQAVATSSKGKLNERIKGFLAKLSKALEGDHEYHKYLGM